MAYLTLPAGDRLIAGTGDGLTDDLPPDPVGSTPILLGQACMSILILLGGIATYYFLD